MTVSSLYSPSAAPTSVGIGAIGGRGVRRFLDDAADQIVAPEEAERSRRVAAACYARAMIGLSRPREIALLLVLAAIIVSAGAWALRSVVPGADAWLVDRANHAALDIALVTFLLSIGLWSWLNHS